MAGKIEKPVLVQPTWRTPEERGQCDIVRGVTIVTPLHGGGVALHPEQDKSFLKDFDRVTPLRSAAVVGQVRFWWRATHGARAASLQEMQQREANLFGAASEPGKVSLRVDTPKWTCKEVPLWESTLAKNGNSWNPKTLPGMEAVAYGAFALQAKAGQPVRTESGVLRAISGIFNLVWTCPTQFQGELCDAIDTWLTFGGVGGRTRRGFGAVCSETTPSWDKLKARLETALGGLPTLPSIAALVPADVVLGQPKESPEAAHSAALAKLRTLRQGVDVGRNRGKLRPEGRSLWPEPDAIRTLQRRSDPAHSKPMYTEILARFPRALFGMPIIFHFQSKSDPSPTSLAPSDRNRMASPLVLRPVRVAGKWAPCCVLLADTARQRMQVALSGQPVEWRLTPKEQATVAQYVKPMKGHSDVLRAFLTHFQNA